MPALLSERYLGSGEQGDAVFPYGLSVARAGYRRPGNSAETRPGERAGRAARRSPVGRDVPVAPLTGETRGAYSARIPEFVDEEGLVVVEGRYRIVDLERGKLERRIFVDEAIYAEELEKVFGRAWLMIGHESLVRNPNDFLLTYMGEDPIILCRTAAGALKAFLNMCRHRGNRIVRADDGNAKNFMCAYHGWTFSNEGRLVSVPGLQEAYYGELAVESLGLVEVAQLDTYAGFVFATWAEDAPTLEAYLGDMRWYMDTHFNRREGGVELIGPDKWVIPCNWKNPADNFVGDMYHAPLSHRSATIALSKMVGREPLPVDYGRPGNQVSPGNGHGTHAQLHPDYEEMFSRSGMFGRSRLLQDYERSIRSEMEQRLGTVRPRVTNGHHTVFPNMSWLQGGTLRIWHPRGPLRTEVWSFVYQDSAASDEVKGARRIGTMQTFGPSGTFEQDDMDNWRNSSEAGRSVIGRRYLQDLSMGKGHETSSTDLPGVMIPRTHGEINQRSMYARWQEFMNADGWSDIRVDPIRGRYDGSATFKG